jgi:PAS domain S-box-containing protein
VLACERTHLIFQHRLASGEVRDVEVNSVPIQINDQTLLYSIIHDITARVEAEEALRESEARYRSLIQDLQVGVVVHDADTTQITTLNPVARELLEVSEEQVEHQSARDEWELLREDGKPMPMNEYPVSQVLVTHQPVRNMITGGYHAGRDETIWTLVNADPRFDRHGDIQEVIVTFQDITKRRRAMEALQRSEAQLRAILDSTQQSFVLINPDYTIQAFNQTAAQQAQAVFEQTMAPGQSIFDYVLSSDEVSFTDHFQEALRGQTVTVEKKMSGGKWFSFAYNPIQSESGEITGVCFNSIDITERKRAEEALRKSKERFETAIKRAPIPMVITDANQDILLYNDKFTQQFGYTLDDVSTAEQWWHTAYPDEAYRQQVQSAWEAAIAKAIEKGSEIDMQEWNIIIRDGSVRRVEFKMTPLGDISLIAMNDITERKRAEQALRESEDRFRTIVNALPQLVAYTDKDLIYRFVNQTYQEKFDVEPEEVIGQSLPDIIGEDAFEEARPHVENALRGEQVRYHERYDYAIGGTCDIDGILVPDIAGDGEVRGYYAVLTDITPYMEMQEELRQSNERIRIQHEIETAILRAQSSEEIAVAALERLHRLIPCRSTSIAEIDPTQQKGRDMIVLIDGEAQTEPEPWHPLTGAGEQLIADIQQGQTYLVDDIAAMETPSPLEQKLVDYGVRSYISVPLMVQEAPVGTLNLGSEAPNFFQSSHIQILEEIAASLAVALQQAHLLEQTRRDAETKALLLQEVNHRVKNNLDAIIGLLYVERRHAPPEALPAYGPIMDDLTQRIMGLAEVHQMLSSVEWAPLNLGELAERIIQTAVQGVQEDVDVTLDVSPTSVYVQPAQAQHLALILSELTTNTLKHGVVGRGAVHIAVQITQQDRVITLTYRNDGPGYAEEVLSLARHSAGLDIVKRSVRKNLQGELALRNEDGAVTEIRFRAEDRK